MIDAVMPTYARAEVAFETGEGPYLTATDGRRFLDFGAGIAVTALGHCHPHLVAALRDQAGKLWHCSNLYRVPGQEKLAQRLVDATFADTVFFTNSGAEAMECGLKIVRRHFDQAGQPERYRVICCANAFHGRTLATIAAGGQSHLLDGFDPVVGGFDHVAFGNLNEMRAAITPETAAILVEPIQGEGGIFPATMEYLRGIREIADEFGLVLFFDEVQSGVGRSGKLFTYEWAGMEPDVMAVAKGLGGGFPVGACLVREQFASLVPGTHGTTFGGNPLAMAAANAVLDIVLSEGFLAGVDAVARRFRARLEALVADHAGVLSEVRGFGLMQAVKCVGENKALVAKLFDHGLLAIAAGDNVVRFVPPLIIEDRHVDEAMAILDASCRELGEVSA